MIIRKIFVVLICFCVSSCYFGSNESSEEIINNFYLAKWDENTWISYSEKGDSIFNPEKIIISHNVYAVATFHKYIIAKQHPCENEEKHFMDYDSLKPNKKITNYIIIDTRSDGYKLYSFNNEKDFNNERTKFGITKSLQYQFYSKGLE